MAQLEEAAPVFSLDSSLTIAEAVAVQQKMLDLLRTESALILDGTDVEQIDGAGIQLLAAFMKEAGERNIAIRWFGVSDRLRLAADQLGLGGFLGLNPTD